MYRELPIILLLLVTVGFDTTGYTVREGETTEVVLEVTDGTLAREITVDLTTMSDSGANGMAPCIRCAPLWLMISSLQLPTTVCLPVWYLVLVLPAVV